MYIPAPAVDCSLHVEDFRANSRVILPVYRRSGKLLKGASISLSSSHAAARGSITPFNRNVSHSHTHTYARVIATEWFVIFAPVSFVDFNQCPYSSLSLSVFHLSCTYYIHARARIHVCTEPRMIVRRAKSTTTTSIEIFRSHWLNGRACVCMRCAFALATTAAAVVMVMTQATLALGDARGNLVLLIFLVCLVTRYTREL